MLEPITVPERATLALSGVLWAIYGGATPLVRGRPTITSSRTEARVMLTVLVLAFVVDVALAWSAWNAGASGPTVGLLFGPFAGGLVGTLVLARRGHLERGVDREASGGPSSRPSARAGTPTVRGATLTGGLR